MPARLDMFYIKERNQIKKMGDSTNNAPEEESGKEDSEPPEAECLTSRAFEAEYLFSPSLKEPSSSPQCFFSAVVPT